MRLSSGVMTATFCFVLMLFPAVIPPALGEASGEVLTAGVPVARCPILYVDIGTGEAVGVGVNFMRCTAKAAGYSASFQQMAETH